MDKFRFIKVSHDGYEVDLPSVTTIINAARRRNLLEEEYYMPRYSEALRVGSETHAIINRINQGAKISTSEWDILDDRVKNSIRAYLRWKDKAHFRPTRSEFYVYSFNYLYAGTIDAFGYAKRYACMPEFKTGMLKPELATLQISAYVNAYLEMFPKYRLSQFIIVRLNRDTGGFEELSLTEDDLQYHFSKFIDIKNRVGII